MAKHRSQPKSKARQSLARRKPAPRPAPQAQATQPITTPRVITPPAPSQPLPIQRRSTYFEAVAIYEQGLTALQRHDFPTAAELFESVLRLYPEERELHERVRLYLNVCKRHVKPREDAPQTLEERLYAATLAFNGGRYDEAILHLRLVPGRSMIDRVVATAARLQPSSITLVVGHEADAIKRAVTGYASLGFVVQEPQLGTGHALLCTETAFKGRTGTLLLLSGDVPLLSAETLEKLLKT